MFRIYIVFITVLCGLNPLFAHAQVYKYIDNKGKIHYSDTPFAYRQKDFKRGDNEAVLDANKAKFNKEFIQGVWDVYAKSKHLNSDNLPDNGKWQFDGNGSITTQKGDLIVNTKYRFQDRLIEIIESEQWIPYQIVSLTNNKMILKNDSTGIIHYFKKNNLVNTVSKATKHVYRRDQIVELVLYFSCMGVKYQDMSNNEKNSVRNDIFEITGIKGFDEDIFVTSVDHYKNDPIFLETYQPKIVKEVTKCRESNVVPRFDIQ